MTSVPYLIPVVFAIFFAARFSAYFILPRFQPWANVVSSVSSHFKTHYIFLIEFFIAIISSIYWSAVRVPKFETNLHTCIRGRSVADFFGGFSVTRRRSIASRRVTENPPKKSATEPPLYMCVFHQSQRSIACWHAEALLSYKAQREHLGQYSFVFSDGSKCWRKGRAQNYYYHQNML